MAYIGRQLVRGQNRVLDDISGSFNGSTTAFNLTVSSSSSPPASVNQLWIILGGILQKPGTDFTVADAVITFTTAPAATLSFWGMIQGDTSDINSPADASVTPSKIANSGDFAFPADVRFKDADGSHYVGLQAPSTVSSNLVWSLPAADGSANQLLKTDGSGNLGWASDTQSNLLDEDNMSSNSATQPASQQSIKAYVDAGDLSLIDEDNMSTDSATRPPSQQSVKAYADTKAVLTGSTDNTVCTVTGANAISGESNLIFDGTNLGIGCTPSRELHVKGLDGTIRLESTAATGRTWIEFFDNSAIKGSIGYPSSGNDNLAIQQTENADMYFTTNDTTRLTIKAGGDIEAANNLKTNNLSGRNLIINGSCLINQRGSSSTSTGHQTVDRFTISSGGTDEALTQEQVDVSSGTDPYNKGFRKAFKVTNGNQTSTGTQDYAIISYNVEAQDLANSGWNYTSTSSYITISFWAKSSVAKTFNLSLYTADGTSQAYNHRYALAANTWTKITHTFPGASNITVNNDNGVGIQFMFQMYMGTHFTSGSTVDQWVTYGGYTSTPDDTDDWWETNDATFELTGLQLEVGSIATEFEHKSYGEELARCQRYCYLAAGGASASVGMGTMYASGTMISVMPFPVEMRTTPTLSATTGTNYYEFVRNSAADWFNSLSLDNRTTPQRGEIYNDTETSGTVGHTGYIRTDNAAVKVIFNAEL